MNNEYLTEQELTDRYGDMIMKKVATSVYKRCCSKDEQIKGADYLFPRRIDLKFDYYDNDNVIIEDYNAQWKDHTESWLWHGDPSDMVCYVKMARSVLILFSKEELREFANTEVYSNRIPIKARSSETLFKNFRYGEIDESRSHLIMLDFGFNITPKKGSDFIYGGGNI